MRDDTRSPIPTGNEQHERELNRHRGEEQRVARAETVARLRDRGVVVRDDDSLELVVEMLDAVEAFETAVERRGGDLMVDTASARKPDDKRFVMPARADGESGREYLTRLKHATSRLMRDD